MTECRYHSKDLHTYTSWHYEVTVQLATKKFFIYRVNPILQPDILTQIYSNVCNGPLQAERTNVVIELFGLYIKLIFLHIMVLSGTRSNLTIIFFPIDVLHTGVILLSRITIVSDHMIKRHIGHNNFIIFITSCDILHDVECTIDDYFNKHTNNGGFSNRTNQQKYIKL